MTSRHDPQRTRVLYERTRTVQRAVRDSDLELEEIRAEVRTALAAVRRAQRSWAARSSRPLRWLGRTPDPVRIAPHADELEAAVAELETLDHRLTDPATPTANSSRLEADTHAGHQ